MKRTTSSIAAIAGQTVAAAIVFFAIGLATRMPALAFDQFYGLHATLAAPFYAFGICLAIRKGVGVAPIAAGSVIYGLILGAMSPVMAVGAIAPALALIATWILAKSSTDAKRAFAAAVSYGTLVYPATLVGGLAFGSASMSLEGFAITAAVMFALSTLLAVVGAAIATPSRKSAGAA